MNSTSGESQSTGRSTMPDMPYTNVYSTDSMSSWKPTAMKFTSRYRHGSMTTWPVNMAHSTAMP